MTKKLITPGVSRRKFMGGVAGTAAASSVLGAPFVARAADPLRTIGLGVSIINEIQAKASEDMGAEIRGQALGYGALFGKRLNGGMAGVAALTDKKEHPGSHTGR